MDEEARERNNYKKLVKNMIKSWKVVVFHNRDCPRGEDVKGHFEAIQVSIEAYEMEDLTLAEQIQAELNRITGSTIMPKVFVEGQYIGSMEEIQSAFMDGSLYSLSETKTYWGE